MKQYSTIFLDWHKTVSHSLFWGHWQEINHPNNHVFKNIQSTLFGSSTERINNWMRGKYTTEQIIEYISEQTHQNYRLLLSECIKSCQTMQYCSPHIPQLIKDLRTRKIKVFITTDNMDSFTRWTVPALRLDTLFDDVFNSHDLKVLKTDTDEKGQSLFFKDIGRNYDIKNCVLIDDNPDIEPIIRKSNIDFLHVNQENNLEKYLQILKS